MKISIRTKLLLMCIFLVFLTATGISATYYVLSRREKQRESRQHIQIAFDVILDDGQERLTHYSERFHEFISRESTPAWSADIYNKDHQQATSSQFVVSYLLTLAEDIKNFGYISSLDRLMLYTADKRLLLAYHRQEDGRDFVGAYLISESGNNTYFALDNPGEVSSLIFTDVRFPDVPLPDGIPPSYSGEFPNKTTAGIVSDGSHPLTRIVVPLIRKEKVIGVLVGEVVYREQDVKKYARLSKTAVNFFTGSVLSIGTLPAQDHLDPELLSQQVSCQKLLEDGSGSLVEIVPIVFNNQHYYQGQCVLSDVYGRVGAITVSLSQEFEKKALHRILTVMFLISGIAVAAAFLLSAVFSRRAMDAIQNIVRVIGSASEGDLRYTTTVASYDEIGMLGQKLNQMIRQLRDISGQVQKSSFSVGETADAILREIETLTQRIEQQSISVDNTTESIRRINQFISLIDEDSDELLAAAEQILSSIHEVSASRREATKNMGNLANNLHVIFNSVEQVDKSARHISENVGHLEGVAKQTESEMLRIDQSFKNVSENADLSLTLAQETQKAALSGQESVQTSILGMIEIKKAVTKTVQIIREVDSWGTQVSSILDIVDEITEQTSLLALNASIISAQAGSHGRGFAVVADEIKDLAVRTKSSTQKIAALVHALQQKTDEGVKHTTEGLKKADQGMQSARIVKEALDTILTRATHSSERAANTAQVVQDTAASSRIISTSVSSITDMVSQIRTAIKEQGHDISQVVEAVENSQVMSEQINQASTEQNRTAEQIEQSMQIMTDKLSSISHQTEELTRNSSQIVEAMHTIEEIAENILQEITVISGKTANDLVNQSEVLQNIVKVFKVS